MAQHQEGPPYDIFPCIHMKTLYCNEMRVNAAVLQDFTQIHGFVVKIPLNPC